MSAGNPTESFDSLMRDVRACRLCRGLPLAHRPILQAAATARILIAGQAPGRITHHQGRPFDDPSGERLREWLGIGADTFYDPGRIALVPMGFCYPGTGSGGDLPPRPECAGTWRRRLLDGMPRVRLTVVLGQHALRWHLGTPASRSLSSIVGEWRSYWPRLMPLPHPSPRNRLWLRRHPQVEADMLPALRRRVEELLNE